MPKPTRLSWFPARPVVQALVEPSPGVALDPDRPITLTFSRPVRTIFGTSLPTVTPPVPGRWHLLDTHTLTFRPGGLGYPLSGHVAVHLPEPVGLAQAAGGGNTRTLAWEVRHGTILRLQQLLAQAGYLPLRWSPAADPVTPTARTELAATAEPPAGRFHWRYENTPHELHALWQTGKWNEIVRGAVMMFEDTHDLDVDGFVGPKVWSALLADTIAGRRRTDGYSYVYVHRNVPQSLTLWHNGQTILRSPGNTGVPAAPTQLGSFPVFEHIPIGTMSGTNPDGSHYNDPGIRYISYFNHGDAIHAFTALELRHAAEPRLRRAPTRRRRQGVAVHPDRHSGHGRELTARTSATGACGRAVRGSLDGYWESRKRRGIGCSWRMGRSWGIATLLARSQRLRDGLELFRGEPLLGCRDEPFARRPTSSASRSPGLGSSRPTARSRPGGVRIVSRPARSRASRRRPPSSAGRA